MSLKLTIQQEVAVITLMGDVDIDDAVAIKNLISDLIANECYQVVLELGRVAHIHAIGLGILAESVRRLRSFHGDLKLSNLNLYVKNILELLGMAKSFKIFNNAEAAVKSYRALSMAA